MHETSRKTLFVKDFVQESEQAEEEVHKVHVKGDPKPEFYLLCSVVEIIDLVDLSLTDLSVLVSTALEDFEVLDFVEIAINSVELIAHCHAYDRSHDKVGKLRPAAVYKKSPGPEKFDMQFVRKKNENMVQKAIPHLRNVS